MVSALTADGRVLVGQLSCEGTTMPARDEAFIWQRTGDPGHPLEKLWEGRLASPASALPSSGVDLFATYRYVDGPLGNVTSLDGLGDDVSISVVLQFSGASGFTLGAARQAPGAYFFDGRSASFAELEERYCRSRSS